jgi:hypothetical protein
MSAPADDLGKSADELIADMEQLIKEGCSSSNPAFNTGKQMAALRKFACVLTVTARATDVQTRRIVRLTWALVWLSAVLLLFTVFLYVDTHALMQRERTQAAPAPMPSPSPSATTHQ